MAKRITHARAAELLENVTMTGAAKIGSLLPVGTEWGAEKREELRKYFNGMEDLGFSRDEADELLRYNTQ